MTYNTGNPVPSTDPRDLLDNAQALDALVTGPEPTYPDRKGVARKSWAGMETDFAAAQGDKEQRFQAFLLASGYVDLGDYAAGLSITARNQVFRRDGEFYRAAAALELPYTLTGDWVADGQSFVAMGDAVLRQDLYQDAGWVGYLSPLAGAVARTLGSRLGDTVSVKDFGAIGDGVSDDTAAFLAAEAVADSIYVQAGDYLVNAELTKRYYGAGALILNGSRMSLANPAQDVNYNTLLGHSAGAILDTGISNLCLGYAAGRNITTGYRNISIGTNGMSGNALLNPVVPVTGNNNIGVGFHALKKLETGVMNVGIGTDAGNEITTGQSNTCVGGSAGQQITIGYDNTLLGRSAGLRLGTDARTTPWSPIGGTGNVAVGRDSLRNGFDCNYNTALGYQSMRGTKDETDLTGNLTGGYNVAIGYRAMFTNPVTAASNTVVGCEAGQALSGGNNNVIIGREAGRDFDGSGNIIIGRSAYRAATALDNRFVVANQSSTAFLDGIMAGPVHADNILTIDAFVRPASDNSRPLGSSSRRWSVVFAATATISTSDERAKQQLKPVDEAALDAWSRVEYMQYKFNDAVEQKGDGARWHFGVIAQRVKEAFEAEGLDAFAYGLLCFDEWEDEFEPILEWRDVAVQDADGNPITERREVETGELRLIRPAGNRYGIRYEEALALEAALMRRTTQRLEARLAALESA